MKPDFDIIMLALARWDGLYSSTAYSLARELSHSTRVFYIDNPFTWKDFIFRRSDDQIRRRKGALLGQSTPFHRPDTSQQSLIAATPQLITPANWLPPGKAYDLIAKANDRVVFRLIERIISEFNVDKFVFVNAFNPLFGRFFPAAFSPDLNVYYCVDDIGQSEYISKHGTYLEDYAVSRADVTLVTSLELKRLKSSAARDVRYLPNAADVALFQRATTTSYSRPADLPQPGAGKKLVFYMGNICQRLDYTLLRSIADDGRYLLVMTGPATNDNYRRFGLDVHPNVVFTGKKKITDLPAYLHYIDCCIIPFLCNTLTRSIYPLKINEYLSAGKPVVTTNFSEDISNFAEVAFVSSNHDEFMTNVGRAIETDDEQKRMQRVRFAAGNSWSARAAEFFDIVSSKLNKQ